MRGGDEPRQRPLLPGTAATSLLLLAAGLVAGGYRWRARRAEARNQELETQVKERTSELTARVKELNCLFGISDLTSKQNVPLEEILQGTVLLLQQAWPNPNAVCATIVLDARQFNTCNYRITPWQHSAPILIHNEPAGWVTVGYLAPYIAAPEMVAPPLGREMSRLLDAVAERLGKIAQRLQSERVLHTLTHAVEESPDAVVVSDVQGRIEYVNPTFTRVTGYSAEEAIGQNPRFLGSGIQTPKFYQELWETITSGQEWHGEFINRAKDGGLFWELATISPVKDPDGTITHFVKVSENITARKQLEDALKITHHFLTIANRHNDLDSLVQEFVVQTQALTGCTLVGIRVAEPDGSRPVTTYAGPGPRLPAGECKAAIAGARCMWLERRAGASDPDSAALCTICQEHDYRSGAVIPIRVRDRSAGHLLIFDVREDRIQPLTIQTLDEAGLLLGTAIERVRAQEAVRASEKTGRLLLDAPSDLALLLEPDGAVVALNQALANVLGRSTGEVIGQKALAVFAPHLASMIRSGLEAVAGSGQPCSLGEILEEGKTYDVRVYPIQDDAGRLIRAALYARDITERKQMEAELRKTRDELASLLAVSTELVSTLDLEPLLDLILERLAAMISFDNASILTLSGDALQVQAHRGYEPGTDFSELIMARDEASAVRDMLRTKWPFYIADYRPVPDRTVDSWTGLPTRLVPADNHSWLAAPLLVKNQMIGILTLGHHEVRFYDREALHIVQAFANQAAIAIANARIYQQAQELATAEERTRLAHELHDSVTQTLFSANLIAHALPDALARDPARASENLEKLGKLTQGALAQMRSLLLEVRPAGLTEEQLGVLLGHLAEGMAARTGIAIDLCVEGECVLPPDVQIALYRIAQEALNNMMKHAGASQAEIALSSEGPFVRLLIRDNGRGFDPTAVSSSHLGIGFMRERAEKVGANVSVESRPGQGTQIMVTWMGPGERKHHEQRISH
jgi:PAS domain S-box-containing protein